MGKKLLTIEQAYNEIIKTGGLQNVQTKGLGYKDLLNMGFKPTDSVKTLTTEANVKKLEAKNFVTNRYQTIRQLIRAGGIGDTENPFIGGDADVKARRAETGLQDVSAAGKKITHTPNLRGYINSINQAITELTKKGDPKSLSLKNYLIMMTTAGLRQEHLVQGVSRHNYNVDEGVFRNIITKGTGEQAAKVYQNYDLGDVHRRVINQQVELAKQQGWQNKLWHTNTSTMANQLTAILKPIFKKNNVNWIHNNTGNPKSFTIGDLRNQTSRIFISFNNAEKLSRFLGHAVKTVGEKFYGSQGLTKAELSTLGKNIPKVLTTLADDLDNMYKIIFGDLVGHNITDNAKKHGINLSGTAIGNTPRTSQAALKGHVDHLTGRNLALDIQLDEVEENVDKKIKQIEKKEKVLDEKINKKEKVVEKARPKSIISRILSSIGKGSAKALPYTQVLEPFRYGRTAEQRTGELLGQYAVFANEVPEDYYTDDRAKQMETDEFWKVTTESYTGAEPEPMDQKLLQLKKEEGSYLSPEEEILLMDMQNIPHA